MKKLLHVFIILNFLVACSSTTIINVNDKDVRIYADDQLLGKGSASYSDTKIMNSTTILKLKKQGCEDQMISLTRNEEIDWLACAGGCLVLVPFLWVQKYKPSRTYEFECTKTK